MNGIVRGDQVLCLQGLDSAMHGLHADLGSTRS